MEQIRIVEICYLPFLTQFILIDKEDYIYRSYPHLLMPFSKSRLVALMLDENGT